MNAPPNTCLGKRTVLVGNRMELKLVCQIGVHRGGDCRTVLPGTDVIVIFKKEKS